MTALESLWPYVAALLPTAGLLFLFWVLMKHILEGDRRERAAQREWEASHSGEAARSPTTDVRDGPEESSTVRHPKE